MKNTLFNKKQINVQKLCETINYFV